MISSNFSDIDKINSAFKFQMILDISSILNKLARSPNFVYRLHSNDYLDIDKLESFRTSLLDLEEYYNDKQI